MARTHKSTQPAESVVTLPEAGNDKGEPVAPWRGKLTERQEEVCELAADLIINGGHSTAVENLIWAVLYHKRLRTFPNYPRDANERERRANQEATEEQAKYSKELSRYWPESAPPEEDPKPTTISEMVRANLRSQLRDRFESFMQKTKGLEEIYMLYEIFLNYDSGEGELGESFAQLLDDSYTYVKVPAKYQKRIQAIARLIENDAAA